MLNWIVVWCSHQWEIRYGRVHISLLCMFGMIQLFRVAMATRGKHYDCARKLDQETHGKDYE